MPRIMIDEDVWRELQKRGEPLVDTPSDVIGRLLGLEEGSSVAGDGPASDGRGAGHREPRTPDAAFRLPILEALTRLGGRGRASEVTDTVGEVMKPTLKEIDNTRQRTGLIRWRESTSFERLHMSQETPRLVTLPRRGWWEITDPGRDYLRRHRDGHSPD